MRSAWTLAVLAACSVDGSFQGDAGVPSLDTTVGGIRFRLASGTTTVKGSEVGLYLSDQPDTCQAISGVPQRTATTLALRAAPQADGGTQAVIVAAKPAPGPGEAIGSLTVSTAGRINDSLEANSGAVSWTQNADSTVTITELDAGFQDTTDRLTLPGPATVPPCR